MKISYMVQIIILYYFLEKKKEKKKHITCNLEATRKGDFPFDWKLENHSSSFPFYFQETHFESASTFLLFFFVWQKVFIFRCVTVLCVRVCGGRLFTFHITNFFRYFLRPSHVPFFLFSLLFPFLLCPKIYKPYSLIRQTTPAMH